MDGFCFLIFTRLENLYNTLTDEATIVDLNTILYLSNSKTINFYQDMNNIIKRN